MRAVLHHGQDLERLVQLVHQTPQAKQRDRYRVVLLAVEGMEGEELDRETIARVVGRSRQFVDQWVGRYRRSGLDALVPKKQPGAEPKLTVEQQEQLKQLLERGPEPEEGIAAYNGPILKEKIEHHFGVIYSTSGLYELLHRLGYNDLMPRPRHPDSDPEEQARFKKRVAPAS
jgi:transposase